MKPIDERRMTAKSDRHHHGGEHRLAQHRPHHKAFDDEAEQNGKQDRAKRHHEDIAADRGRDGPCDIGHYHGHLALREIDQAGRLVDHRETHRDQAIDGADGEPGDQQLDQIFHQPAAP